MQNEEDFQAYAGAWLSLTGSPALVSSIFLLCVTSFYSQLKSFIQPSIATGNQMFLFPPCITTHLELGGV